MNDNEWKFPEPGWGDEPEHAEEQSSSAFDESGISVTPAVAPQNQEGEDSRRLLSEDPSSKQEGLQEETGIPVAGQPCGPAQWLPPYDPYAPYRSGNYPPPYNNGPQQGYGDYPPPYGAAPPFNSQQPNPYAGWQGNGPYGYGGQPVYAPPYSAEVPQVPLGAPPPSWGGGPKQKMSRGAKVFLIVIGFLASALILSFLIYGILLGTGNGGNGGGSIPSSSQSEEGGSSSNSNNSSQPGLEIPSFPNGGVDPGSSGIPLTGKPTGREKTAKEVYRNVVDSVVGVVTEITDANGKKVSEGQGSGIVATSDGYIITNSHVVGNSKRYAVQVVLHNNEKYAAVVVGYDVSTDLAILKIDAMGLSPAQFSSSESMEIGDSVVAIGNPGGLTFSSSMTGGIISALNRTLRDNQKNNTYIQTDAAINPGNSGGALVNMDGQVIGINSNKIANVDYEGMGFAIPMERAKTVLDDLLRLGYVQGRGRLGITVIPLTAAEVMQYNVKGGIKIVALSPGSPLEGKAMAGDAIVKVDGQDIASSEELYILLGGHKAGDTLKLTLAGADGKSRDVEATLIPDEGETQKVISQPSE